MLSKAFFDGVRSSIFGGTLKPAQVAGLNAIGAAWSEFGDDTGNDGFGYILATVLNEVGAAFQPKAESLTYTSPERIRAVWPTRFRTLAAAKPYVRNAEALAEKVYGGRADLGNTQPGDGFRYRGRGYSQITGRANYAKFGKLLGLDLIGNPALVMDPTIGAKILVIGMVRGMFTGKKLADYFGADKRDAINARRTVNGDVGLNGKKIAGYWQKFVAALGDEDVSTLPAEPARLPPIEDHEADIAPPASHGARPSWLALTIIIGLAAIVGVSMWLLGLQAPAGGEVSLLGPPVPHDRPFGFLGDAGGGSVWTDIGMQIVLAFVAPLVSAAAAAAVGWIVYWWGRLLKADFDQKSADALHKALERGMLAALEAFGGRASKAKLISSAADYAEQWNPGTVKRMRLTRDDLEQLAVPHLAAVQRPNRGGA